MNYIKIISILFVAFIIAEVFYNYNNKTSRLVNYYLKLSEYNPSFLQNAIKIKLERNSKIYPEYQYKGDEYKLNLQELEIYREDKINFSEKYLPLILYNIAIKSFISEDKSNFIDLLEKSILIDPDLSFSYVELANYFLLNGQEEKGIDLLQKCMSRSYPRIHCSNYLNRYNTNRDYFHTGSLKEDFQDYIDKSSK